MDTISLPPPTASISEVLLALIEGKEVKERIFAFNSFRDAISQLRNHYGLPIRHIDVEGVSKFGRPCKYRKHFLLRADVKKAKALYEKINKR